MLELGVVMTGKLFFVLMFSVQGIIAQSITVSQDTLLIRNDPRNSTSPDSLTLINQGIEAVSLDSLQIQFDVLDTGGMMRIIDGALYIGFTEMSNNSVISGSAWILDSINAMSYRYVVDTSRQAERERLSLNGSGDSTVIIQMVIGGCPMCAAYYFPAYLKGVLRFFYRNGQTIELQIESANDFREPVRIDNVFPRYHSGSSTSSTVQYHYLVNGRQASETIVKLGRNRLRHIFYEFPSHRKR